MFKPDPRQHLLSAEELVGREDPPFPVEPPLLVGVDLLVPCREGLGVRDGCCRRRGRSRGCAHWRRRRLRCRGQGGRRPLPRSLHKQVSHDRRHNAVLSTLHLVVGTVDAGAVDEGVDDLRRELLDVLAWQ